MADRVLRRELNIGYDIYMVREGETEEEFFRRDDRLDDEYFRATLTSMSVLRAAMAEAGVFERVDPYPFNFMEGALVTSPECDFIAKALAASPRRSDDVEAEFVDCFRQYCERAAQVGGFRVC